MGRFVWDHNMHNHERTPNKRMHATRDTAPVMFLRGAGGRVMRGVRQHERWEDRKPMLKQAFAITLALVSATLAYGLRQTEAWVRFSSAEGHFSVLFPGKPAHETEAHELYAGHSFTAETEWATYAVMYADFKAAIGDPGGALDGARDVLLAGKELVSETEMKLNGYAGRELKVKSGGGMAVSVTRLYLVGNRLYNVTVVFAPAGTYDPAGVEKFFSSFKLTGKRAGPGAFTREFPCRRPARFSSAVIFQMTAVCHFSTTEESFFRRCPPTTLYNRIVPFV